MSGNQQNEISKCLSTVSEAIEAIKNGGIIIVVDDEDRENEGDFIAAVIYSAAAVKTKGIS